MTTDPFDGLPIEPPVPIPPYTGPTAYYPHADEWARVGFARVARTQKQVYFLAVFLLLATILLAVRTELAFSTMQHQAHEQCLRSNEIRAALIPQLPALDCDDN